MTHSVRILCLAPLLTAGAATLPGLLPHGEREATPAAVARPGTPALPQDPERASIWKSAEFKRQFEQSYLAESDVEPKLTATDRDLMQRVYAAMEAQKPAEALQLLEAERNDASSAVVDFTVGSIHFQDERLAEAKAAYTAAVRKYPKFRRAWRNLALVHVRESNFAAAIEAFTRTIELGGTDSTTYGLLGYAYSNTENHLAAETAYRFAVLMDAQLLDWQFGLARSLFKQERFAEAAALCGPLIHKNPDRGDLWMLQANAYLGLGNTRKAAESLEMLDRIGQSTVESLNTLGDIYVNQELFDLAVGAYLRSLDVGAPAPDRALRAAKVLTARNAIEESKQLLAALDQTFGSKLEGKQKRELLHLRARIALAEGAGEEEAAVLKEMVALDPLDGDALILLGQQGQRTGNVEQAAFWFERAAGIEAFEADAKLAHARLLVGQSRFREALPLLKRALALKPRDTVQQYYEQVERLAGGR